MVVKIRIREEDDFSGFNFGLGITDDDGGLWAALFTSDDITLRGKQKLFTLFECAGLQVDVNGLRYQSYVNLDSGDVVKAARTIKDGRLMAHLENGAWLKIDDFDSQFIHSSLYAKTTPKKSILNRIKSLLVI